METRRTKIKKQSFLKMSVKIEGTLQESITTAVLKFSKKLPEYDLNDC
jgi:hypothetical protein